MPDAIQPRSSLLPAIGLGAPAATLAAADREAVTALRLGGLAQAASPAPAHAGGARWERLGPNAEHVRLLAEGGLSQSGLLPGGSAPQGETLR